MTIIDNLQFNFNTALERDGVTATAFTTNEDYPVFLRTYEDNRSERNVAKMYYSSDYEDELSAGKIISIADKYWIIINQESPENNVYRKSTIVQTNGYINLADRTLIGLPAYGEPIVNSNQTNSDIYYFSLDGDTDIITETDNPMFQSLNIGDIVNIYGRYFKITNLFDVNGIAHIIIEVTEKPANAVTEDDFTAVFMGLNTSITKDINSNETLDFRMYNHGIPMKYIDVNYSSSNTTVATITPFDAQVHYCAEGTVIFTASCMNVDFYKHTPQITVKTGLNVNGYSIYFGPESTLMPVLENYIDVFLAYGGKMNTTYPLSFKIENNSFPDKVKSDIVITTTNTGIKVVVKGSNIKWGDSFDILAYNTILNVSARKTYTIERL